MSEARAKTPSGMVRPSLLVSSERTDRYGPAISAVM